MEALRGEVIAGLSKVAGYCPWFEALWEKARGDAVGVVAARTLLPFAQDAAAQEMRRQSASAEARVRMGKEAREALRTRVSDVLSLAPSGDDDLDDETVSRLLEAFDGLQLACQGVARAVQGDSDGEELRRAAEKLSTLGFGAQRALAEAEQVHGVNAIFLTPPRLAAGAALLGAALLLRMPIVILVLLAAAALFVGYRWYVGYRATEESLAKLRSFGLHGRTFLRNTDPAEKT